jgi:hypothetical protein
VKSRALLNGSKKSVALPASIGWRSDYGLCGPRFSSGNLAMFPATRRASSFVSNLAADHRPGDRPRNGKRYSSA